MRVLGPGRWSPDKVGGREGGKEGGRKFLRVWGIGQSRQEEVGEENAGGDEDPAGQLDNLDIQLGRQLKFQVQVPQTSAIPLPPWRFWPYLHTS